MWLEKALKKKTFDRKMLTASVICSISDEDVDEWRTLLEEWDLAETHTAKVDYWQKALDLEGRKAIPPLLHERYKRLISESKNAQNKLQNLESFIETQLRHLQRQIDRRHSGNLSRCAADIFQYLEPMKGFEKGHWLPEQVDELQKYYTEARLYTERFFDEWLGMQSLNRILEVDRFRRTMDLIYDNLHTINLREQAEKLDKRAKEEIHAVQESHRLSFILDEADAFLKTSGTIHKQASIKQLWECGKRCKEIAKQLRQLEKIKPTKESRRLLETVEKVQAQAKAQRDEHRKRGDAILESKITCLEDVRKQAAEARLLEQIFFGEDLDVENFHVMGNILENVSKHGTEFLSSDALSNAELKSLIQERQSETEGLLGEDDGVPWNIQEVYSILENAAITERSRLGKDWLAKYVENIDLESKDPMEIQRQLEKLESAPVFLSEEQRSEVSSIKESLNGRLDSLKVEGLLARFRSQQAQRLLED
jgi:hypothetical protein